MNVSEFDLEGATVDYLAGLMDDIRACIKDLETIDRAKAAHLDDFIKTFDGFDKIMRHLCKRPRL